MESALSAGISGFQRAMTSAAQNAERVSDAARSGNSADLVDASLALRADVRQGAAAGKVVQVARTLDRALLAIA